MKKIKIKLTYHEMQVLDWLLLQQCHMLDVSQYHNKAIIALTSEYALKNVKPHTFLQYFKTKTISLPLSVACALIYLYQSVLILHPYNANVIQKLVMLIEPQIIKSK